MKDAILSTLKEKLTHLPDIAVRVVERERSGDFIYITHLVRNGQTMKGHWNINHFNLWHRREVMTQEGLQIHETATNYQLHNTEDAERFCEWFLAGIQLLPSRKK
ncbi:hypothetical protein C9J01_18700 [Photobacterium rosenbergii]|uniref:Uncharacterized protein n=1 Tax=Photobacterium rosenbergii TaxID=294936 RepID=A0A2T3N9U0_9GAMM|nr:hypothetical protein [Photobacterium rosenbergii]PSW10244.1 hypothetical protein C9J01_18700 [Photobacterium rosenbergii]